MAPVAIAPLILLIVLTSGAGCASKSTRASTLPPKAPRSVSEAAELLKKKWLDASGRDWILRNPKDEVAIDLHLPFGSSVRNAFGLWGRGAQLLESCGVDDAEDCSGIIFERLWETVRADADPRLVRELDCQFELVPLISIRYAGFYKLRMGEILNRMQAQIDEQLPRIRGQLSGGCGASLSLRVSGHPNLSCWTRAEFSEDGGDPVPLLRFFGWFSWRNGFRIRHVPPAIDLMFGTKCAWPKMPAEFIPGRFRPFRTQIDR